MGYTAFEKLRMEYRALQLIAILVESKLKNEPGISAADIVQEMGKRIGEIFYNDDIHTLIVQIAETWNYGKEITVEHIEKAGTIPGDKRVPLYRLRDDFKPEMWNQLMRVAFSIAMLKHGVIKFLEGQNSPSESKEEDYLHMMNLVTALEKGTEIYTTDAYSRIRNHYIPKNITMEHAPFVKYDTRVGPDGERLDLLLKGSIDLEL
jgi:hypothetical protein